ncbi:spherical body protein, putative [Babesia ovis]|uniref:Spherical body protein, putative n=1 Tax=Babesia ovis TaxID=5869 RepID=A0A9W5WW58_BABOV|nr:spherical body protein, putative [Babesia ovis]
MASIRRILRFVIFALALVMNIVQIDAITIDLEAPNLPEGIEAFDGTFSGGGKFRLFHSKHIVITAIKYKNCHHKFAITAKARPAINYMQIYIKDDMVIVELNSFVEGSFRRHYNNICQIIEDKCMKINRKTKKDMVNSVRIPVDLYAPKTHPLAMTPEETSSGNLLTMQAIPVVQRFSSMNKTNYFTYTMNPILLSPILGLDIDSKDVDGPETMLVCQCRKLRYIRGTNYITIFLKNFKHKRHHLVEIPPCVKGIFRPTNILHNPYDLASLPPSITIVRNVQISIDVASIDADHPHIVILFNLKRGKWLYTQYTVVALNYPDYPSITVRDSIYLCELYDADPNEYVLYVEVFDHRSDEFHYVIINLAKRDGLYISYIKKVFTREIQNEGGCYLEAPSDVAESYIEQLYNLNLNEARNDFSDEFIIPQAPQETVPIKTAVPKIAAADSTQEVPIGNLEDIYLDNVEDVHFDNIQEVPVDNIEDIHVDNIEDTPVENMEEVRYDTTEDTPVGNIDDINVDTIEDMEVNNMDDLPGSSNEYVDVERLYELPIFNFNELEPTSIMELSRPMPPGYMMDVPNTTDLQTTAALLRSSTELFD